MLHVFYLDVVYVAMTIHVCCKCMFQIFQLFQRMLQVFYLDVSYVASVCFKCFSCFKCMLQVSCLDVAYVALAISICCNCMFQMFQLFQTYVASILSGCCKCCNDYIHMLQASVCNVSFITDVYLSKCFMLQVLHNQAREVDANGGDPLGHSGPCVRACGKQSVHGGPHMHAQAHE
jgi:hypothetical protein